MHCVRDIGSAGDIHCGALGICITSHRPPGNTSLLLEQKHHIAQQYFTRSLSYKPLLGKERWQA